MRLALFLLLLAGQETDADRARKLLEQRKFADAIELFTKLADREPKAGWPWVNIGYAWTELRAFDKAEKAYAAAKERDPDNAWLPFNRGRTFALAGRMDDARRELELSIEKHPTTFPHWTRLWIGVAWIATDAARALDWIEQAFERDPAAVEKELLYWRNYGFALYKLGRYQRASRAYADALAKFPDDAWLLQMRALCHLRNGESAKAREVGRKAEAALKDGMTTTELHPPFRGRWQVVQGNDGEETHWGLTGKYAWDFVAVDGKGDFSRPDPKRLEDYFSWNAEVLAPADGTVVVAVDQYDDHLGFSGNDPGEGNHVLVKHAEGEISSVYHLRKGSVAVKAGDKVKRGDLLGRCGSSGYSNLPHIHYVVVNDASTWMCRPSRFAGVDKPVPKTGDIVEGK